MQIKNNNQHIQFDHISVNVIENSSGIFVGTNHQCNWNASTKSNAAFGSIYGDHIQVMHNFNVLYDNDGIDTLIDPRSNTKK